VFLREACLGACYDLGAEYRFSRRECFVQGIVISKNNQKAGRFTSTAADPKRIQPQIFADSLIGTAD
jgi:hypothetical protein